jgi:hypothetical protein
MDDFYEIFADWARRYGPSEACERFRPVIGANVDVFREQLDRDRKAVQEGGPVVITAGPQDWYPGPLSHDVYWPALRKDFQTKGWPEERIDAVDRASTKVVAHTPRPDGQAWSCKGLVVGYVQSGKTTNFTSVVAKLADIEYRLVIVLSGIHNGLRRQTQARLDEQLKQLNPEKWNTLTDELRDFHPPTMAPGAALSGGKVALVVAKKNVTVLKRLIRWFGSEAGRQALSGGPVAIIDDEADQASVATQRINPLIRQLLALAPRCTYIGYTATPFANVFIDPATTNDLYPRNFILNLPRPEGYFGPEAIFGREPDDGEDPNEAPVGFDMIRRIPDEDVGRLRPTGKQNSFVPELRGEVESAVRWFLLATAARSARGDHGHSTMLIHTSVKTEVHEAFRRPLQELLKEMAQDVAGGRLTEFRGQWEEESERVPASHWNRPSSRFDDLVPHLRALLDVDGEGTPVTVVLDNSRSQERLVYGQERVVAIAVGGNTLSRGLTLEGLICSVFVRGASAYDTLLQMGRWFGYRGGHEELPRIWMTRELEEAFRHLASVEFEMRREIDGYQLQNLTPADVAVRIRTHPYLQITSKMGAARPAYISFAGRRLQTRYFQHLSREWLERNELAAQRLVEDAVRYGSRDATADHILFRDVPVGFIEAFLTAYQVHPDSPDLDPELMVKYIRARADADEPTLRLWSVAVVQGTGNTPVTLGGIDVKPSIRSRVNADGDRADIKTLMSKQDRALDLRLPPGLAKNLAENDLVRLRNEDPEHAERGLLVLYVIDPESRPTEKQPGQAARYDLGAVHPVVGVGLVFPGDPDTKTAVRPRYVAVDLTGVEQNDELRDLEVDTEDVAA